LMPSLSIGRILLPEIDLFGQHWTARDFVVWLAKQSRKKKEMFIRDVLDRYGLTSSEFYFVMQVMVVILLVRYGYADDDVFQSCIMKILELVQYFDPAKGKLLSFIHCIVRDQVTLARYHSRKARFQLAFGSCFFSDSNESDDNSLLFESDGISDLVDFALRMRLNKSREDLCRILSEDTVYRRVWNWMTAAGRF
jgi:hypothetical protein